MASLSMVFAGLAPMDGTMRRRYVHVACLLSAILFAPTARADDSRTAEAEARFKEGLVLADGGQYEAARLKFLQALEMKKVASILFNLAGVESKGGHDVEAIEHYRAFLKLAPADPRITDTLTETAKKRIDELLGKVGRVEVDAPADATIAVDGRPIEGVPADPIPVTPGKHVVKGTLHGKTVSVTVNPDRGEVAKAKLDFSGGEAVILPPAEVDGGKRTTAGWVIPIGLGVVGVAGVVVGAAFASASNSSKDDLDRQREASPGVCAAPRGPLCAAYDDQVSKVNNQATVAWVGYGVGALGLAASVATFFLLPKSSKSSNASSRSSGPSASVVPLFGPRVAGANLQLQF